jgi:uncharacterized protein YjiS (DUF1127 family)
MALFETARPVTGHTFGARIASFLPNLFGSVVDAYDRFQTRKALNKLSNRELEDIGLVRADIVDM